MARASTAFICQTCGAVHAKWGGKCDDCGSWNTLVEETVSAPFAGKASSGAAKPKARRSKGLDFVDLEGESEPLARLHTGIAELDRVLGGGIVPGSAILVGGDPGIGKSTLMLQAAALMAKSGANIAYVSGEESIDQVRGRARRLGFGDAPVHLATETALGPILEGLKSTKPDVAIIDSVQTLWSDAVASAPGSVTQVRACTQELVQFAKRRSTAIILVGHVTKDGQIAGPRVLEHMVDAVLYFEGDRAHQFRILRGVKNRFGPTDEIGVFEMLDGGLSEVVNPSALFLGAREKPASGSIVFAGMEGSRPVLVEIQALVAPSSLGTPRRAVVGWDSGRLAMVLAVFEARCGLSFTGRDVYLNVAGGLKIAEPAADLAVAAALASAAFDVPLPADMVVFGEASLSGEVRPVARAEARLKEAAKLGFAAALAPQACAKAGGKKVKVTGVATLGELAAIVEQSREGTA